MSTLNYSIFDEPLLIRSAVNLTAVYKPSWRPSQCSIGCMKAITFASPQKRKQFFTYLEKQIITCKMVKLVTLSHASSKWPPILRLINVNLVSKE